jgi:hypothetical protein
MRNFEVGIDEVIFLVKEDDVVVWALLTPKATADLPTFSDYPVGSQITDLTSNKVLLVGAAGWETITAS